MRGAAEPSSLRGVRAALTAGAGAAESASAGATLGGGAADKALLFTSGSGATLGRCASSPGVGCCDGAALEMSVASARACHHHSPPPTAASVPNPSADTASNTDFGGVIGAAGRSEIPAALVDSARAGTMDGGGNGLFLISLRKPTGP